MTAGLQPSNLRRVQLRRVAPGRYRATNDRGGEVTMGTTAEPDLTPVELLLAAIAGCSAIDVDLITGKRAPAESFQVTTQAHKVRDQGGNHLTGIRVTFDLVFPDGEAGDRAREFLPKAVAMTRDRLCTVGRTVALGEPVGYDVSAG